MMTTVTNQNTGTPSRLSRLQDANDYKIKHGWTPLTPEEEVEFHKMVAEFTNLQSMRYLLDTCIMHSSIYADCEELVKVLTHRCKKLDGVE